MNESVELIRVIRLPEIEEHLQTLKDRWDRRAAETEAMICTEDTIAAVKSYRAEMRKEFEAVEALRKEVKKAIMEPYDRFEARYKKRVTDSFRAADGTCARKISEVESEQKRRCEEGLRDYFAELCAVRHLDWLEYDRAGIKVDMASARAKTPKKLRERLAEFVKDVSETVGVISTMNSAEEMMVEYQRCLNFADAYDAVQERHRRIEEERAAQEARKAVLEQEAEAVRRVEALAPPVVTEVPEPIVKCTFTVKATKSQLRKLKDFLKMEGIQYE